MRGLVREAGLEHAVRDRQRRHRRLARGRRARSPRDRGARARGVDARGRGAPGPPARLRALRPTAGDGPREPARAADASRPTTTRPARCGCCARSTRSAGAPDLDVPDPYYGGDGRLRDGARPGRGRLPRPARHAAVNLCGRRARRRTGRAVRGLRAGRRRRHQRRLPRAVRGRVASRSSRRARTSRRASTRRRRRGCAGWPSRARCACPRCSAWASGVLVLDWVDEGAARGEPTAFGAGLAAVHARGRATRLRRPDPAAAPGVAWTHARTTPRPTGRPSTPSGGCCRCCRTPGSRASATRRVERVCARMPRPAPDRPSRPRACTATCGAATCCGGATGRPWLIDPAAYGGHREVDLAMLRLFGVARSRTSSPPTRSATRSRPATRSASQLYQLFPLLVHAALFGGGYPASAERVARKYAA